MFHLYPNVSHDDKGELFSIHREPVDAEAPNKGLEVIEDIIDRMETAIYNELGAGEAEEFIRFIYQIAQDKLEGIKYDKRTDEEFEADLRAPAALPSEKEKLLRHINNAIAVSREHLKQTKKQSEEIEQYLEELRATRVSVERHIDQIPSLWDIDIETIPLGETYTNTEADITITIDRGEDSK
jgi:DNA-directed RNA polymerase beta' subunit